MRKCRVRQRLRGRSARRVTAIAAAFCALVTGSCRDAALALGSPVPAAAAHADGLFGAFALRFDGVFRDRKFERARDRLAGDALVPSRIFDDTASWSVRPTPVTRSLFVEGLHTASGYQFLSRSTPIPPPSATAHSRHVITLTRLSKDEFAWDTDVDFGIGDLRADDVGTLIAALLRAPENRSEGEVRADVRAAFPRAAAAFGRYVTIDTIHAQTGSDGTTSTTAVFLTDPNKLEASYPAFGAYLAKYADPMRMTLTLSDGGGVPWIDLVARDRRLRMRWRSQRGRLLPLYGPPRYLPDTLRLTMDWTMKVGLFTVGVRKLNMNMIVTARPHERAWTFVARQEPEWVLPLAVEHLIGSSLRRPFAGEGARFDIVVADSAGAPTLVSRRLHVIVQEGAILRFLSRLSSHAVSEFDQRAEREEERFLHDGFLALQGDARALLAGK